LRHDRIAFMIKTVLS